jgi:hypothetical protein
MEIRHVMAVTKSKLPVDDPGVEILTSPQAGSLTRTPNGDLLFVPGNDFADLVPGETRRVNFEYLRDGANGSRVGTATVAVRAEPQGVTVERFEFADTQTVSHKIVLEPGLSPARPGKFRIRRHPDKGRASLSQGGELTFRPLNDFDNLMNGEVRSVSLQCEFADTEHPRLYEVELTVKAGFHGVFVQRSIVKEQLIACNAN